MQRGAGRPSRGRSEWPGQTGNPVMLSQHHETNHKMRVKKHLKKEGYSFTDLCLLTRIRKKIRNREIHSKA